MVKARHARRRQQALAAVAAPEELYALWRSAVERSRAAWAGVLADGGLDQPSKFTTRSGQSPNLRRVLVDLHDEYAPPRRPRRPPPRGRRRSGRRGPAAVTARWRGRHSIAEEDLRIVAANEASWDDLAAIFGTTGYPSRCQCQRFKVVGLIWRDSTQEQRTAMLRAQTPAAARTPRPPAGWWPTSTTSRRVVMRIDFQAAGGRAQPGPERTV